MYPAWQESLGIVPPDAVFISAGEHRCGEGVDANEILPMTDTRFHGARNLRIIHPVRCKLA